jgi:hypothetical protein
MHNPAQQIIKFRCARNTICCVPAAAAINFCKTSIPTAATVVTPASTLSTALAMSTAARICLLLALNCAITVALHAPLPRLHSTAHDAPPLSPCSAFPQLNYSVDGDAIVVSNGGRFLNRPLYGPNNGAYAFGGDRPVARLAAGSDVLGYFLFALVPASAGVAAPANDDGDSMIVGAVGGVAAAAIVNNASAAASGAPAGATVGCIGVPTAAGASAWAHVDPALNVSAEYRPAQFRWRLQPAVGGPQVVIDLMPAAEGIGMVARIAGVRGDDGSCFSSDHDEGGNGDAALVWAFGGIAGGGFNPTGADPAVNPTSTAVRSYVHVCVRALRCAWIFVRRQLLSPRLPPPPSTCLPPRN